MRYGKNHPFDQSRYAFSASLRVAAELSLIADREVDSVLRVKGGSEEESEVVGRGWNESSAVLLRSLCLSPGQREEG